LPKPSPNSPCIVSHESSDLELKLAEVENSLAEKIALVTQPQRDIKKKDKKISKLATSYEFLPLTIVGIQILSPTVPCRHLLALKVRPRNHSPVLARRSRHTSGIAKSLLHQSGGYIAKVWLTLRQDLRSCVWMVKSQVSPPSILFACTVCLLYAYLYGSH
jgi:hypothetical protein